MSLPDNGQGTLGGGRCWLMEVAVVRAAADFESGVLLRLTKVVCSLRTIGALAFAASLTLFRASSSHCAQSSLALSRSSVRCATNASFSSEGQ